MATWQFLNAPAQSTVALAMTNSQTSAVLASSAAFGNPTGGQQIALLGLDTGAPGYDKNNPFASNWEYVFETGNVVGTNTITIIRGQAGTTGKAFFAGSTWSAVILKEALAGDGTGAFLPDNGRSLYTARGWQGTQQTMLNATPARLLLDTKSYDPNTNLDVTGTKGTYTCPVAGKYLVCGAFSIGPSGRLQLWVAKNGTVYGRGGDTGAGSVAQGIGVSDIVDCAANDTITLVAQQSSAGSILTDNTDQSRNFMSVHYLGI